MPKLIGGRKLTEVSALQPPKQEKIGKHLCYRLEGLYADNKVALWIETDPFLILKIVEDIGKPDVQTISYVPKMNEKIPDQLFDKQVEDEWKHLRPIALNETSSTEKPIHDNEP